MTLIGVISDTHGLLRPEALEALRGVDRIIHAGDVGNPAILPQLEAIAPVHVVRGNIDRGEWAEQLPSTEVVEAAGQLIYVLHDLQALDLDPKAARFRVVFSGHSHKPHLLSVYCEQIQLAIAGNLSELCSGYSFTIAFLLIRLSCCA